MGIHTYRLRVLIEKGTSFAFMLSRLFVVEKGIDGMRNSSARYLYLRKYYNVYIQVRWMDFFSFRNDGRWMETFREIRIVSTLSFKPNFRPDRFERYNSNDNFSKYFIQRIASTVH